MSTLRGRPASLIALLLMLGLAGCVGTDRTILPTAVVCVPLRTEQGWRLDLFVRFEATNQQDVLLRLKGEQFTLQASTGKFQPDKSSDSAHYGFKQTDPWATFQPRNVFVSRAIQPGQTEVGWLAFRGVATLDKAGGSEQESATVRRQMVDKLGKLHPQLAFHGRSGRSRIDLSRFTALPEVPVVEPTQPGEPVLIDLRYGLNGLMLQALEDRLRSDGYGDNEKVLLAVGGDVDPCFYEWWPPDKSTVTPAELKVMLARPSPVDIEWNRMFTGSRTVTRMTIMPPASQPEMPWSDGTMTRTLPDRLVKAWLADDDPHLAMGVMPLVAGTQEGLEPALNWLRNGPTIDVKLAACSALQAYRADALGPDRAKVEAALSDAIASGDDRLRQAAMQAANQIGLAKVGLAAAKEQLLGDNATREEYETAVKSGDPSVIPLLRQRLQERHDVQAARALLELKDPEVLDQIRQAIKAAPDKPPSGFIQLLGEHGAKQDGDLLASLYTATIPDYIRTQMITAMGKLGGEKSMQCILKVAQSGDPPKDHYVGSGDMVRRAAIQALKASGDARAVPIFETMAADYQCRHDCIDGLAKLGTPEAIAALKRLSKSSDQGIGRTAQRELGRRQAQEARERSRDGKHSLTSRDRTP